VLTLAAGRRTAQAIIDGPPQASLRNLFCENELRLCVIQFAKAGEQPGCRRPQIPFPRQTLRDNP
jgi:hypothetical protein